MVEVDRVDVVDVDVVVDGVTVVVDDVVVVVDSVVNVVVEVQFVSSLSQSVSLSQTKNLDMHVPSLQMKSSG
ncbi:hypothetical protein DPMN_060893 [Dreissena polymorpha]|uniref:Uncharacterized protein n=1 Tax=Dreissena polymorpha TaxID=45954 RepID=A0A9D4C6X4_DREPO|nr:hypothetical protein DPMN_060893 [Dreissena polymorpha]